LHGGVDDGVGQCGINMIFNKKLCNSIFSAGSYGKNLWLLRWSLVIAITVTSIVCKYPSGFYAYRDFMYAYLLPELDGAAELRDIKKP
jgi:hypothetical protein